jgi:hypothetical protein
LDDIKLVRLNVIRYLIEKLYTSHDSFALGSTKHEALVEFVEQCFQVHVDVALLDVHLEYDDDLVLGIDDVAIELRKRGFKNTIMLHSANEQSVALQRLRISVENNVDGFLEKRAFEKEFIERCILKKIVTEEEIMLEVDNLICSALKKEWNIVKICIQDGRHLSDEIIG